MTRRLMRTAVAVGTVAACAAGCHRQPVSAALMANGYVEATEVRVASKVSGRVQEVKVVEGQRVSAGDPLVRLDTTDADLALARARADRNEAEANLRLLQAGSRPEDIAQAEAEVASATADERAATSDLSAAQADEARYEQLLRDNAGSVKQRDDAVSHREVAEAKLHGADDRVRAATATLNRLKAGARPEEIDAAKARVAAVDAQIATVEQNRADATIVVPSGGVVSSRLAEPGELVVPGTPLIVMIDLDHAWASVYVEDGLVPSLRLNQPATVITDRGDRRDGAVSFIASQAEFTPRNVQTSDERAKLVYRVKVSVDNRDGLLKPGMPVEAEFRPAGQ